MAGLPESVSKKRQESPKDGTKRYEKDYHHHSDLPAPFPRQRGYLPKKNPDIQL